MRGLDFFISSPKNLPRRLNWRGAALLSLLAGMLSAAALPPGNISLLAWVTLTPVIASALSCGNVFAAFSCGWLWGVGRAWFAYAFLREIDPAVPWLLAPIIALWPGVWAAMLPWFWRSTMFDLETRLGGFEARSQVLRGGAGIGRMTLFVFGTAALFTLLEWTRSRLFVWNDLAVTQWRVPVVTQIASVAGSYALIFVIALVNAALFALFFRRARFAALPAAAVLALVLIFGAVRLHCRPGVPDETRELALLLIQGDLSQRRHGGLDSAREAFDVYRDLTTAARARHPEAEVTLWPESAVPVPFFHDRDLAREYALSGYGLLCREYQQAVRRLAASGGPMLIGAIDTSPTTADGKAGPGMTNSALYFDGHGMLKAKYDKIHRVPFGEYVPFRSLLPQWVIDRIDMGRDLVPGTNFEPVEIAGSIPVGIAVCYEGVFGYLTREFARRGARMLVVLSNDAWYPRSSEPEQHLANAVIRSVETGLPMVRVGNNGGSGVVTPEGVFTQGLVTPGGETRPELGRGRAFGVVRVRPRAAGAEPTFFVRHGEWFIVLLAVLTAGWTVFAGRSWQGFRRELLRRSRVNSR